MVWDNNFDPLEILNRLNDNVNITHNNLLKHEREIQELRQKLKHQQELIDTLISAVNVSSLHQEQMLKKFLETIEKGIEKNG
jgi:regulator of sigma D